jgi:hypothetical protein
MRKPIAVAGTNIIEVTLRNETGFVAGCEGKIGRNQ